MAGDPDEARKQLRAANMPVVHAFAVRIMGKFDQEIHRRRMIERPAVVAKAARRPSPLVEAAIFATGDWLAEHPKFGTETDEADVRRWPMTDFRYTFFYKIDWSDDALDVLRVMDARQVRNLKRVPR